MSICLTQQHGVTAKKQHWCALCGERIPAGSRYDLRKGVADGFYTMRMHPECHRYEMTPEVHRRLNDWDWYEDISEPAFERSEVHHSEELQLGAPKEQP